MKNSAEFHFRSSSRYALNISLFSAVLAVITLRVQWWELCNWHRESETEYIICVPTRIWSELPQYSQSLFLRLFFFCRFSHVGKYYIKVRTALHTRSQDGHKTAWRRRIGWKALETNGQMCGKHIGQPWCETMRSAEVQRERRWVCATRQILGTEVDRSRL